MIKVAVFGADSPDAGELIRILAGHPDVEPVAAQASGLEGIPLHSRHHGLIGETSLAFSNTADISRADVAFLCGRDIPAGLAASIRDRKPDIKVIDLSRTTAPIAPALEEGTVYALPEINRKALVRGAMSARVPSPFASLALVPLFPLALNLLLGDDIKIRITAPEEIIADHDPKSLSEEIKKQLKEIQNSFNADIDIEMAPANSRRSAILSLECPCQIDLEHLRNIYSVYDDHNFAFPTMQPVGVSEVAGTDKCVFTISKPDTDTLRIEAVADCRLRGGAGEAVHVMNLMFGLHEKTGLRLKAIDFSPIDAEGDVKSEN